MRNRRARPRRAAGIARFRLEFVHETAAQVTAVTRAFEEALAGRCTGRELMRQLQKAAPRGVTQGSFFVPKATSHWRYHSKPPA